MSLIERSLIVKKLRINLGTRKRGAIYVCLSVRVCVFECMCRCVCLCRSVCLYVHVSVWVCVWVWAWVCMWVCLSGYVCMAECAWETMFVWERECVDGWVCLCLCVWECVWEVWVWVCVWSRPFVLWCSSFTVKLPLMLNWRSQSSALKHTHSTRNTVKHTLTQSHKQRDNTVTHRHSVPQTHTNTQPADTDKSQLELNLGVKFEEHEWV